MLYLEDYLEMIEHLPQELRDRFTEMREMDLQVQNSMDSLEDRIQQLFCNAKKFKVEQRDVEYDKIRQDYYKSLEDADEKVNMANQMYDLVDKYLRRLDQELQKFKMELEADNAGITEILEKRSLELDNPPPSGPLMSVTNNHQPKSEKRKYTTSQTSYSAANGSDKRAEKALNALAVQDVLQESLKYSRPQPPTVVTHHQSASTSPFSSNHGSPIPSAATQQPSHLINLGHMGAGSNAIAAAASQAIAATQQMQQGRRTASLKASFQVINSGLPAAFNKELTVGREVGNPTLPIGAGNATSPAGVQVITTAVGLGSTATVAAAVAAAATTTIGGTGTSSLGASSAAGGSSGGGVGLGLGGSTLNPIAASASSSTMCGLPMIVAPSLSPVPEIKSARQKKQTKSGNVIELPIDPPVLSPEECQAAHIMMDETGQPVDWAFDPNEPRYCICNQVSYGDMVACDNEDCPVEWFHYNCVGITQPPRGKWYCPQCTAAMRRRGRKDAK